MLNLSDKHGMIQKIAEKLAKDKVAPRAKEIDSTGAFPWDLVDLYKKHGFLYLMLPEKFGGLDGDITVVVPCDRRAGEGFRGGVPDPAGA